jgi:hypothetical protein
MRHLDHIYDQLIFYNFIGNAINALPDPVTILTRKFNATFGSWVDGKRIDARQNPLNVLIGNTAKIFCDTG